MSDPLMPVEILERIHEFSVRGSNDELTEEHWAEFEQLLRENDDACRMYGQYVDVSGLLPAILSSLSAETAPSTDVAFPEPLEPARSPALPLLGTFWHGAIGFFSQEIPFALLVGTVITSLGLWAGSMVYVTHNTQLASDTPRPTPLVAPCEREIVTPDMEFVGRVTGMVDVKWSDINTSTERGNGVPLGRKYALASGLMEITYDTGARVILQGPVTYEVDSRDSGFLSVGKLTARLEKRGEGRGESQEKQSAISGQQSASAASVANQKSEILNHKSLASSPQPLAPNANPQSPIPNPSLSPLPSPLFTIKTPTATVTDLGTEFGVEVDNQGGTLSHVFRGKVEVQPIVSGRQLGQTILLSENQSVRVEKQSNNTTSSISRVTVDPEYFVRAEQRSRLAEELRRNMKPVAFLRWQAFSRELRRDSSLLAYYDFQRLPENPTRLANVAENGKNAYDGKINNATWTAGHMAGKDALSFNGPSDHVAINLPQQVRDLSTLGWFYVMSIDNAFNGLLMSEGWKRPGAVHWQILDDGRVSLLFSDDISRGLGSSVIIDQWSLFRWTHLAAVYNHTTRQIKLFRNGVVVSRGQYPNVISLCIGPAHLGLWSVGSWKDVPPAYRHRSFHGQIGELAIFGRPLADDEVHKAFKAGTPVSIQAKNIDAIVQPLKQPSAYR